VYWIAVYDILEEAGLEVYLVNARETKNLPGRKSDVQESQWLMKLHTYGLLRNSFRPSEEIRRLRTYWRLRNDLVQAAGRHIQRMQKALTQMNIQLANVLSDISGKSGQAIIHAILEGERDPYELAAMCDVRVQASEEEVARALVRRQLARRSAVYAQAGTGRLRVLSEANGRVRRAALPISPAEIGPERGCQSAGRETEGTAGKAQEE
jgi:DNA-binding protein YbaB